MAGYSRCVSSTRRSQMETFPRPGSSTYIPKTGNPARLRALHYKDLAAVHLKTAREVNLGARWEEMMRALGNTEAKVHRATIGSSCLASFGRLALAGNNNHDARSVLTKEGDRRNTCPQRTDHSM